MKVIKPFHSLTFPILSRQINCEHLFVLRQPEVNVQTDRETAIQRLQSYYDLASRHLGFEPEQVRYAEQIHGSEVQCVDSGSVMKTLGVDALITQDPKVLLAIYVADCCAVYLVDPVKRVLGLAHAGRKGAELAITAKTIEKMRTTYGTRPQDLWVQLSPCIRPPHFEVDFVSLIVAQASEQGVPLTQIQVAEESTAMDLKRFYSYRMEQGKTGRMLALLGLTSSERS